MDRERFEQLVVAAIEALPEEFLARLENIDIVVDDFPSPAQLARANLSRGETLLGLYEGVPLTRRTTGYGMLPPDKITIFQKPIESKCGSDNAAGIAAEIRTTVQHEIAHHFGIGDARLKEIERAKFGSQSVRPQSKNRQLRSQGYLEID
jgi:predicted Zn-dependent protease with MMP-like domain